MRLAPHPLKLRAFLSLNQYICIGVMLTFLSGCGIVPPGISLAHTMLDVILHDKTGKSSGEHVLSEVTGEDCQFIRFIDTNKICMTRKEYEDYLFSLNCDTYTWDIIGRVKCTNKDLTKETK